TFQPLADEATNHYHIVRYKLGDMRCMPPSPAFSEQVLDPIAKLVRVQTDTGLPQCLGEMVNDKAPRIIEVRKATRAVQLWIRPPVIARAPVAASTCDVGRGFRHAHGL